MSKVPDGARSRWSDSPQRAELDKLNGESPVRGFGSSVFAPIYLLAISVGFASLAVARFSAGRGPNDACGYNADSWTVSVLPFGFTCHYSNEVFTGDDAWRGPPEVFHELSTPAMVVFLAAAATLVVTVVVHAVRTRNPSGTRIEPGQFG